MIELCDSTVCLTLDYGHFVVVIKLKLNPFNPSKQILAKFCTWILSFIQQTRYGILLNFNTGIGFRITIYTQTPILQTEHTLIERYTKTCHGILTTNFLLKAMHEQC